MQRLMKNPVSRKSEVQPPRGSHGVQAAETLLGVLSAFVGTEPMPMLKTLAERAGMPPAKAHRYLVSLCRTGYVEQDVRTSRYRLGPEALRLAFATIAAVDSISVAKPLLRQICQKVQHSVVLAVWNVAGPAIALKESSPGWLSVTVPEGTILPLLRSSIGRAFAAWAPRTDTAALLSAELDALRTAPVTGCPITLKETELLLAKVRKEGLACATGQMAPGVHSLAAPVFDGAGRITAVLAAVGPAGSFDVALSGATARQLRESAASLSHQLGYSQDT